MRIRDRIRQMESFSLSLWFLEHAVLGTEEWNPWEVDEKNDLLQKSANSLQLSKEMKLQKDQTDFRVQIWGKAAIGKNLWSLLLFYWILYKPILKFTGIHFLL